MEHNLLSMCFVEWCPHALTELCHVLLRGALPKDDGVRCSNWEHRPLSAAQRQYAAADAYASLRCYQVPAPDVLLN